MKIKSTLARTVIFCFQKKDGNVEKIIVNPGMNEIDQAPKAFMTKVKAVGDAATAYFDEGDMTIYTPRKKVKDMDLKEAK